MLEIIPFEPEHLRNLQARSFEGREMAAFADPEAQAREYLRRGPAFSGLIEGRLMGCLGVCLLWRGVAEVWMVTTDLVAQFPLAFHRAISQGIAVMEKSLNLWRLQVAVHHEHKISRNWLRRLNFQEEGEMPRYGPDGATYVRMARVKGKEEPCLL